MNWIYILYCYLFANGVTLFFISLFRIKKNPATRYYFFQYIILLLLVTEFVFIWHIFRNVSFFCYPDLPIRFLLTPFIYLYVCAYIDPAYKPTRKILLLLFTPAAAELACFFVISIYYFIHPHTQKERMIIANTSYYYIIRTSFALLFNIGCIYFAYTKVKIFSWNIFKVLSNFRKLNFLWLKVILAISFFLWIFWAVVFIAEITITLVPAVNYMYYTLYILVGLILLIFGYFSILKPYVPEAYAQVNKEIKVITDAIPEDEFMLKERVLPVTNAEQISKNDTAEPKNESTVFKAYFELLENYLHNNQVYKDPDITMSKIAGDLGTTSFNISKAIKLYSKEGNFYQYINRYRLIHFLQLLSKPENNQYTIITLALKSGFTSASTLNKYCKKITGNTPAGVRTLLESGKKAKELLLS